MTVPADVLAITTSEAIYHRAQGDFVTTIMTQWGRLLPASVKVWLLNFQREAYAKANACPGEPG